MTRGEALVRVRDLAAERERAEQAFAEIGDESNQAIRDAKVAGARVEEIAQASGLGRARVYQILGEDR